jgi:hypothetical protein
LGKNFIEKVPQKRAAVYGPVCPVVWEGEGRETFAYPDLL